MLDCTGYRLPSDAEWEYAYRAGTTTPIYNGALTSCTGVDPNLDKIAWYRHNSGDRLQQVKQKLPNAWGLHDMSGNAAEWCLDWFWGDLTGKDFTKEPVVLVDDGKRNDHVSRGGGYRGEPFHLRAAQRDPSQDTTTFKALGFRCARTAL